MNKIKVQYRIPVNSYFYSDRKVEEIIERESNDKAILYKYKND